jgi:hypothetical protein
MPLVAMGQQILPSSASTMLSVSFVFSLWLRILNFPLLGQSVSSNPKSPCYLREQCFPLLRISGPMKRIGRDFFAVTKQFSTKDGLWNENEWIN